jgi:glucoamylase
LRIEVFAEAVVRWTDNNWETWSDVTTKNTELGVYVADIYSYNSKTCNILFTFFWKQANHWENRDFEIKVENE